MATFNLIRNSKVFFTTNVDSQAAFQNTVASTAANSYQITVLDGFSFSQSTASDSVSISEAGGTANRGSRNFNTALNPAEFSFSTYIRPYLSTTVKAEEAVLWNALLSNTAITDAGVSLGGTTTSATYVAGTGILTIVGTGMTVLTTGNIYIVKGILTVTTASQFNTAVKVVSSSATNLVLQYLTAPAAQTFVAANVPATVTFHSKVWIENAAVTGDTTVGSVPYTEVSTARSNLNQLLAFALVVTVDQVTYALDNCVLDQAVIDFGLDGIATVAWSGKAAGIRQLQTNITYAPPSSGTVAITGGDAAGTLNGVITAASTSTKYITNKLSTVTLASLIGGVAGVNTSKGYNLAITGGSITIANNVNYVTPSNLGVVNTAIGYYTGSRQISGSLTAYLRTGTANTAGLFADMLTSSASNAETKFALTLAIGGASAATKVELYGVGAALQIPTIDAQAVMSTTINFNLQGTDVVVGSTAVGYDLENTNDLRIRYFSN